MSQKLTPDLASKVIRADLKNIIDKVGAGKPLSGVERNLFDGLRLTTEDIGKKRQLSLLGKWSNGKRLNDAELLEIADLLPEGSVPDLEPESEPERKRGRNGFYYTYPKLAEMYESGLRTVKRWKEVGDENGDLCPLDHPEKLRVWWGRNMKTQCPSAILAAAIKESKIESIELDVEIVPEVEDFPPQSTESESSEFQPRELKPIGDDEVGLEATLARLREAEVQANRMLIEALKKGDDGKANLAQSMWTKLTTQVRQVEKDARLEAVAMGQLIPKVFAEQRLVELHSGIERGVRGLYRRMCEVMRIPINAETEASWHIECDRLAVKLNEEVFK